MLRTLIRLSFILTLFWGSRPAFAVPEDTLTPRELNFIEKMSVRKKIGQLFLFGFQGHSMHEGLRDTIKDLAPGGVLVFGRNLQSAQQISDLIAAAQDTSLKTSRLPLLVATDQEGGDVIRIKTAMPLPSALALGKAGREDITEAAGRATGKLLKTLGFNMNLAPVLDIADPEHQAFIGTRTYGAEPDLAGKMGVSFSAGLIQAGVLPTGKHFPGHGGVIQDSHQALPEKDVSREELASLDLVPFNDMQQRLANNWAVMLAHVAFPKIDPTRMPATFSKPIVSDLLRGELGFRGLVITDDIHMAGAAAVHDTRERVLRAIEAGADMIVVAWNRKLQRQLVEAVETAVKSGRLPIARVNESVRRILTVKKRFAVPGNRARPQEIRDALNNPVFEEVAEATIAAQFAHQSEEEEVQLAGFKKWAAGKSLTVFSAVERFAQSFKSALPHREVRAVKVRFAKPEEITKVMRAKPDTVGVFYVSGLMAERVAAKIPEDVAERTLLVTVGTTGNLPNSASFRQTAAVYYRHPNLGKLIADQYFTETEQTRLPASEARNSSR